MTSKKLLEDKQLIKKLLMQNKIDYPVEYMYEDIIHGTKVKIKVYKPQSTPVGGITAQPIRKG
jgi:hypothetical protein